MGKSSRRIDAKDVVELEVLRKPEEVGKAYRFFMVNEKSGQAEVMYYVPMSTVHEIHDDFIVIDKWMANQKGIRY